MTRIRQSPESAPRPHPDARPHPDDWPDDISEPEFLELTKVHAATDRNANARPGTPSSAGETAQDDAMQPYYIVDEIGDEDEQDVILAPDLTDDRLTDDDLADDDPADDHLAHEEPARSPQDFIAQDSIAESPRGNPAQADSGERTAPETARPRRPASPVADDRDLPAGEPEAMRADAGDDERTVDDFEHIYPAEKARQGRIILDKPEKRALFLGGLVGSAIVALAIILIGSI